MARIPVEKKGGAGTPWWLWLLGLILLVGLIWLLVEAFDTEEVEEPVVEEPVVTEPVEPMTGQEVPQRVEAFTNHVETQEVPQEMGPQHEYTSRGIMLLSDALSAVVDRDALGDIDLEARRDTLEQRAQRIQQAPQSPRHANAVRDAFTGAADVMESLQSQYPEANVQQVRQAAQAIDPQTPLLEQRERVQTFFQRASDALETMAMARGVGAGGVGTP